MHSRNIADRTARNSVTTIAEPQHGVLTRSQLTASGFTDKMLRLLLDHGHVRRVARATYVVAGSPRSHQQCLHIAVLSRKKALVSGRSAAWLLAFEGVAMPAQAEITVPSTASGRSLSVRVRRSQHFANIEMIELLRLPVASVAETIFRMSEYVSSPRLARLLDTALLANPDSASMLGDIYLRHQGERMKGMRQLRPLLLERLAGEHAAAESELEALADEVFASAGLPTISRQAPIPWAPSSGRVDRFIVSWRLIIELDGRRWHARAEQSEMDRIRDNAAAANGFSVLRFTWHMLTTQPQRCIGQVLAVGLHAEKRMAPV